MKKFLSLILMTSIICVTGLSSQEFTNSESEEKTDIVFGTSSDVSDASEKKDPDANDGKKHWLVGVGGALFFNLGLATYNRYVIGSSWAKTGPEEWNRFWERTLSWDNDWYWTNFVLHPYQGSLYYMSARGSNLNVLESMAVTVFGSAFWEYLCETNDPSKNDMVYTTVGAFAVGEMMYRLSRAADSKSRAAGFLLNPMRLWTEMWTGQRPKNPFGSIYEFTLAVDGGAAFGHTNVIDWHKYGYADYDENELYPVFGGIDVYVVYNDPYTNDSNTPYNQFELKASLKGGKGSGSGAPCNYEDLDKKMMYNIEIQSDGMLWSRSPSLGESVDTTVGFIMEYDFDWHSWYLISSVAPGFAFKQRYNLQSGNRFEWQAHGAWIALGTADYYILRRSLVDTSTLGVMRPYSYNTGAQTVLKAKYATEKGSSIAFDFHGYAMYDFYDQLKEKASVGWELIGKADLNAELAVSKSVRIGLNDRVYAKRAFYKTGADIFQIFNSASVYAKWAIR